MTSRDVLDRVELGARAAHHLELENTGHRWLRENEIGHRADQAHRKENP